MFIGRCFINTSLTSFIHVLLISAYSHIMHKKKLSGTDTCNKFIAPALQAAGWDVVAQIYRERTLRLGPMALKKKQWSTWLF